MPLLGHHNPPRRDAFDGHDLTRGPGIVREAFAHFVLVFRFDDDHYLIAAAERAGRMGNGFFPAKGDMAELAEIARTTAEEHGRDGAALDITGIHPGLFGEDMAGAVEEAAAWGLDRLVVPSFMFFRSPEESIAAMGEKIAPFVD